jgi:hypothetical protein
MRHIKNISDFITESVLPYEKLTGDELYAFQGPGWRKCIPFNKRDKYFLRKLKSTDPKYYIQINNPHGKNPGGLSITPYAKSWNTSSWSMGVHKTEDEYYLVIRHNTDRFGDNRHEHWRCDQVDGLITLLKNLGVVK